jgi:hypothetical protein
METEEKKLVGFFLITLKLHLHQFQRLSHKEVTQKTLGIKVFLTISDL